MSKLKAVNPSDVDMPKPKILLFGKAGSGKTWSALDFPTTYYIDTESGAKLPRYLKKLKDSGGMYFGTENGANSFETILEQVQALATEKHPYKTLVIDSITKIFSTVVADEQARLGDKDAFGASKKPAIQYMRRLVSWLTRLDMNVILICHETDKWGKDSNGQQSVVGQTFDGWNKLDYELDLAINTFKIGSKHKARVTKSRLEGFQDAEVFDWSYETFAEKYGKNIIEGEVKQLELATPEQIEELYNLLEIVVIDEKEVNQWFKKANCESFEEMDKDKIQSIIDFIKNTKMKGNK